MTPENLPTFENNSESDWWIIEKISKNAASGENSFLNIFRQSAFMRWWKFSFATTALFVIVITGLILAYQDRARIVVLFPNTSSYLVATIQKTLIVPAFFDKIGSSINIRYNLSSSMISLQQLLKSEQPATTPIISEQNILIEKPLKILIDKIGVNASVVNPLTIDLETLNNALKSGAARYPSSGLLGENKNIFIFGHSTSLETETVFYKTFNNLNKLAIGDEIILQSEKNEYIYKVTANYKTNTAEIVRFDEGEKKLTLSTCNTLGQKEERYIVEADFVKMTKLAVPQIGGNIVAPVQPTPTTPANNGGGLQVGDREEYTYEIPPIDPTPYTTQQIDLVATIDIVGILGANNEFIATSTYTTRDKIAVQFTITNIGAKKSEDWYFNAVLPTSPAHIFHSASQQALAPSEKIEFILGFDKPQTGENLAIVINVDPTGGIKESDKTNNIVKEFITIVEYEE